MYVKHIYVCICMCIYTFMYICLMTSCSFDGSRIFPVCGYAAKCMNLLSFVGDVCLKIKRSHTRTYTHKHTRARTRMHACTHT